MKITFEHVTEDWAREAEMPTVPRTDEDVLIGEAEYRVQSVIWQPFAEAGPGVLVRLR